MPAPRKKIASLLQLRPVSAAVRAAEGDAAPDFELICYGDIGESWYGDSVSAKDVVRQLGESNATHIRVRVNSYGGSVTDGAAIYNALRAQVAQGVTVSVRIEGVAASIASLIAMAGDTREMYPNTLMMIHAPWTIAAGNSAQMREMADLLDTYAKAMATSYARATGRSTDEELEQLTDGIDHWLNADDALAEGYATAVLDQAEDQSDTEARAMPRTAPMWAAVSRYRNAPAAIAASVAKPDVPFRLSAIAVTQTPTAAPNAAHSLHQPAASAAQQEFRMNWKAIAQSLGLTLPEAATDATAKALVLSHLKLADGTSDGDVATALARHATEAVVRETNARAAEQSRRADIATRFMAFRNRPELAAMERACLDDMSVSAATASERLLAKLGEHCEPLAGGLPSVQVGETSAQKLMAAAEQALLVRAGVRKDPVSGSAIVYDGANPYRGRTLSEVARMTLEASGVSSNQFDALDMVRASMGVQRVRGSQTTSDFPVILENLLHKLMLTGYQAIKPTWMRFCKTGSVSDFREWKRLTPGMLANLEVVNEAGEYKNKNLPDAEKLGVTVLRRGNIIEITPEVIVNDDLGAIMDTAMQLGMAGPRSVERAVYALLALNSGAGPSITIGGTTGNLFSSTWGTIDTAPAALTVTTLAKGADAMALQKAPGDDEEYLDISPAVSVSRHTVARDVQVLVGSEYDPDASNKLQRPNKVRGIVGDIVGSPRVSSTTAVYLFADPLVAPVIEVVFLNGQQQTRVVQEENFRTAGLAWRGELPFGVGVIGYRGGYLLPGA